MSPKKNLKEHYDDGTLDLSLSEIQEIPVRDIVAIPKAVNLDLSCNNIVSVPKSFPTSLVCLVQLDLSQNQISSLPDNFGLLINLKHLDLDNNKLESLPLSFGDLKSLRWLDVKRNPLMPKVAQIAGLCLDAQQCQAAAKNVVAAFRNMQDQVNAEIAKRKEKKIKKIEKMEEAKNQNKESQTSKKKKKKAANLAANNISAQANGQPHLVNNSENIIPEKEESMPSVPGKKSAQKPGLLKKMTSLLGSVLKFVVLATLLVVFCGFLLSLFDEDLYTSLQKKVSEVIKTNVPKQYLKHWDRGVLVTKKSLSSWSSQIVEISIHSFNRVQEYLVALSSNEVVQQYLESIKSGWHILWIWISETYATLCVALPRYGTSIKRVFFESSSSTP